MLENLSEILNISKTIQSEKKNAQMSLFKNIKNKNNFLNLKSINQKLLNKDLLSLEKEFLGLYLSGHPLQGFEDFLRKKGVTPSAKLPELKEGEIVRLAGVITKIKKIITNSKEPMLFIKIEDYSGSAEIIVFPKVLKEYMSIWQENNIVLIEGKISEKDGEHKIIVTRAKEIKNHL